jgi:RimJ/RimL family protein N-acetyltransferase
MSDQSPATHQRVGRPLPDWTPRPRPGRDVLSGRYCRLEPLDPERHAEQLWAAFERDTTGMGWTYLPYGPFAAFADFRSWVEKMAEGEDPLFFAILDTEGHVVGVASYLRIDPAMGSIEVGHIHYSPLLQRTRAATEAMYLMAWRAFEELGYRRYEWKCDDLNAPSRRAAERLGFTYEGTFRQDRIYKGRNRDTAWYSIIDSEWPAVREALEAWLDPGNFDEQGHQVARLASAK